MINDRLTKRLNLEAKQANKIYRLIAEIDAVKSQWHLAKTLSPQMVQRLQTSVIITSAGASTRIEGSKLSDKQVQALYQNHRISTLKTRDEQEVGGYLDVLELVFDNPANIPFNESSIKTLHAQVLGYSEKDSRHKGSYKTSSNRVEARDGEGKLIGVIFDPTPPHLVSKEMQELIAWTVDAFEADEFHPLLVIGSFIFEFLAIHPFQDGNGRLSRILSNLLLLQQGYAFTPFISHEKIIENNKADYYVALNQTQQTWKLDQENLTPWLAFFLSVLSEQAKQALELLKSEPVELLLSEPQQSILDYVKDGDVFSRRDLVAALDIKQRTVDYSLRKLVALNRLERIGLGRATRYRLKLD